MIRKTSHTGGDSKKKPILRQLPATKFLCSFEIDAKHTALVEQLRPQLLALGARVDANSNVMPESYIHFDDLHSIEDFRAATKALCGLLPSDAINSYLYRFSTNIECTQKHRDTLIKAIDDTSTENCVDMKYIFGRANRHIPDGHGGQLEDISGIPDLKMEEFAIGRRPNLKGSPHTYTDRETFQCGPFYQNNAMHFLKLKKNNGPAAHTVNDYTLQGETMDDKKYHAKNFLINLEILQRSIENVATTYKLATDSVTQMNKIIAQQEREKAAHTHNV